MNGATPMGETVVEVRPVTTRKELARFVRFPERLHRDHQQWVPPLRADERRLLDPKRNRAFRYCDCTVALAYCEGAVVGRVLGIVNRRYNEARGERSARFGHLECIDDQAVAHALLDHVEQWARGQGTTRIVGPMGFTDQDPEGFQVSGFEHEPALATYCNFEYVVRLLETEGYAKEVDYVVYRVPVPHTTPEIYRKLSARILKRGSCSLLEFRRRKQLEPHIEPMLRLMNQTFKDLAGFSPLDEGEMDDLARRYLPVIDPRFVKAVLADDRLVGFMIGVPNMNDGFRKAGGRLLPFGWLHILRAAKRSRQLDLLIGAIAEGHRGRGVDVLLGDAMIRAARDGGFLYMDSHHELEDNYRVRAEMEKVGGEVYKRYRVFQKAL